MPHVRLSSYAVAALLATLPGCVGTSLRTPWDDAVITGAVKVKLIHDYGPALTRIDVETVDRTVYLRGTVPNEAVRGRAEEVALGVRPVRTVVNELRVETRP